MNVNIDVGAREINLNINDKEEKFMLEPRVEQCSSLSVAWLDPSPPPPRIVPQDELVSTS